MGEVDESLNVIEAENGTEPFAKLGPLTVEQKKKSPVEEAGQRIS